MFDQPLILIAEDNEEDVFSVCQAIQQVRMINPFHVVSNGEVAISYFKGEGKFANRSQYPIPQLLILDLKIPRVDGFEVLRWLRQQPDLNAVGVLVLTSSQDMRDVNLAYQLGANSFLHKPVRTECFLNTIMTMNVAIGFGPAQLPPLPVFIRRNGSPAGELERVAIFSAFS